MNLNVNGSLDVKLGSIDFVEQMCEYDIVLFSETWTNKQILTDNIWASNHQKILMLISLANLL